MKKLPESVMIIVPAVLITVLVLVLGFLMVGPDEGVVRPVESLPAPSASVVPTPTSEPTESSKAPSTSTTRGPKRPQGKLVAPQVTLKKKPPVKIYPEANFRIASFNVLGHSHTVNGGRKKHPHPGPTRMNWALQLLASQQIDVVGLQELQIPQWRVLNNHSGTWAAFPGNMDHRTMQNSVAWRRSVFTAVRTELINIPYFGGKDWPMPYVLLEHNVTGQRFWIGNFHNPANTQGNASRWRAEALRRQIDLANRLSADGYPVFITGDMNDRAGYFCGLTGSTNMHSADGGSNEGTCLPPARMNVDWIFGSAQVVFSNFNADRSAAVSRATDHPLVSANATLPERREKIERKGKAD